MHLVRRPFPRPLRLERLDVDGLWMLTEPFAYVRRGGARIEVPAGFITDFASVPSLFWWRLPPAGESYDKAAVVHDWLYANDGVTRAEADRIFLEAMVDLGVSRPRRWLMYGAVRACGWWPWRRHRQAHVQR